MPAISTLEFRIYGSYGDNCETPVPHLYGSNPRNRVQPKLLVLQTSPTNYERNSINISEHLAD